MHIERLQRGEGPRLRAIRLAALLDAPDAFGSTYAETVVRPDVDWEQQIDRLATYVAVEDGADVGMVRGGASDAWSEVAHLVSMWVAPAHRRCGLARALAGRVVDWARAEGFARLVLDVADGNAAAVRLYASLGFEPDGEVGALPAPRDHIREHRRVLVLSAG